MGRDPNDAQRRHPVAPPWKRRKTIGDCVGGAMLAHKASEEGIAAVEHIVKGVGHVKGALALSPITS